MPGASLGASTIAQLRFVYSRRNVTRTILFIVAVVVEIVVGAVIAGVLLARGVDLTPSLGRVILLYVVGGALSTAWILLAGRLIDRWTPAFPDQPDLSEMRAIPEIASIHLESEFLEADCGYHFHLGSRASEQAWAASPLEWGLSYPADWVATLAPQLLNEAGVAHTCEERGNIVRVLIPRIHDSGFDVAVEAASFGVLVRTGTLFHAHFPFSWDDPDYGEREEFREPVDQDASRRPAEQALALSTRSFEPGSADSRATSRRGVLSRGSRGACARPVATTASGNAVPLSLLGET